MLQNLNEQVKEYGRRHRFHGRWTKVLAAMACVVVFCTTYALILPAVTLDNTVLCGMEEHTHGDSCYEQVLSCGMEEGANAHTHGEGCYDAEGNLICTLEESSGHTHSESCYERVLTCQLPEHTHSESCYAKETEAPAADSQPETSAGSASDNQPENGAGATEIQTETAAQTETGNTAETETESETEQETEALTEEETETLVLKDQTVNATVYTDASYTSLYDGAASITLTGHLPEGVAVKAYPVNVTLTDETMTVVEAYDIGLFVKNSKGEEKEYEPEHKVEVKITSGKLQDVDSVSVYHIDDADGANPNPQPELVTEGIAVGDGNEVKFGAEKFSIYAVANKKSTDETETDGEGDVPDNEPSAQADGDTVTLTFNKNGGNTSAPGRMSGNAGETVTLPDYTGTRTEGSWWNQVTYTFMGWTENQAAATLPSSTYGKVYPAGEEYTLENNATLYAVWQKTTLSENDTAAYFYIRLDGKIPYEPGSYEASAYTIGIQIKDAVTVQNWVTDSATEKPIVAGGNCVDNDVYAVLNGVPNDQLIQSACQASGVSYNPETQYILWYVQKYQSLGSSALNQNGQTISTSGSGWHIDGVILDRAKVAISYDPNVPSGVTTIPDVPLGYQVVPGTEVSIGESGSVGSNNYNRANPSIAGYTFLGWNTKRDGTGTHYDNYDKLTLNENTTLYAQWSSTGNVLQLKKVDSSGNEVDGAQFTIQAADGTPGSFDAGTYTNNRIATNTVYTIIETKAPDGYAGLASPFHFIVRSDGDALSAYLCDADGNALSGGLPEGVSLTYSNSTVQINVTNTKSTVDLTLKKVDGTNANTVLDGAEFTLYTDEACSNQVSFTSGNDGYTVADSRSTTITAGETTLHGLSCGQAYYLVETKAPDGYNLLTDKIVIRITANGGITASYGGGGSNNVAEINPDTDPATLTIKNSTGAALPNTGGIGTRMYTLSGLILAAAAALGCLMYSGRKRWKGGAR